MVYGLAASKWSSSHGPRNDAPDMPSSSSRAGTGAPGGWGSVRGAPRSWRRAVRAWGRSDVDRRLGAHQGVPHGELDTGQPRADPAVGGEQRRLDVVGREPGAVGLDVLELAAQVHRAG